MAAGMIRDQALAVSGLLHETLGGPSVEPYQPVGLWKEVSGTAYEPGPGRDLYRRSLYTYWKRTVAPPSMMNFDASNREVCTVHVKRTNTPLQALNLMNDVTFFEAARHLAEQVMQGPNRSSLERIREAYRNVLGRAPSAEEAEVLEALLHSYLERYASDVDAAEAFVGVGELAQDMRSDPDELAAYMGLASLVLNLDETITKH